MSDEPTDPAPSPASLDERESGNSHLVTPTDELSANFGRPASEKTDSGNQSQGDLGLAHLAATAGDWQSVDWNMVRAERISGWIFFLIVIMAAGGVLIATTILNWPPGIAIGLSWLGFALIAAFLVWVVHFLPALHYKHLSYRLGSLGLEIQRGIFWKRRITVPISRVQHTDVAQGPLQRRFEIGKITVYTAGTQNASVELDGLNFRVAGKLRDSLVVQSEAADGV